MPVNFRKSNILYPEYWTLGSEGTTGYNVLISGINQRINGTNPFGQSSVVWEAGSNGNINGPAGGFIGDFFNIDKTKLYRFSVWVKKTTNTTSGRYYFGMNGKTSGSGDVIGRTDGGANEGNPYWHCSLGDTYTQNTWYLIVGHVFPFNTVYTGRHPDTGLYTVAGGATKVANIDGCNIGNDLKWLSDSTQALHRTFLYYSGDNTEKYHIFDPKVEICDGTELRIIDLLNNNNPQLLNNTIIKEGGGRRHNFGDGSSYYNPAESGYHLKLNYPKKTTGYYWIKSEKMPVPLYMYVDMDEEGGGYDFYFITGGPSVYSVFDTNGGTSLGLDLVMPRSTYHWRAMVNAVNNQRPSGTFNNYFQTCYGIYSPTSSVSETTRFMRSTWYNPPGAGASGAQYYRVKDGGRWWLRDSTFTEPNGNYTANQVLGLVSAGYSISTSYALTDISFDDANTAYPTGNYYLVSTNQKP